MRYFEHFYHFSLAKRLLRGAFGDSNGHVFGRKESSLLSEWGVLNALPPMALTSDMISDVEQAADRMSDFRHHLLARIDNDDYMYPPSSALTLAVKPGILNVHVLTASCWPKGILFPVSYAAIKLPYPLSTMANEFENFYLSSSSNRVTYSKLPHTVSGPLGLGNEVRRTPAKGTKKLHWCHGLGSVTLSCRIQSKQSRPSSVVHNGYPTLSSSSSSSSTSITNVTIVLSTPQAAVLMAFQSSMSSNSGVVDYNQQVEIKKSLFNLGTLTGLWEEELRAVVSSLCDTSAPVLQVALDSQNKEIFSLSEQLMTGNLKGTREGDTLIVRARGIHPCPRSLTSPGKGLIRSWRDNMIDACIIRTLKGVERDRSGVFTDSKGRTLRAVISSDILDGLVKASLEAKIRLVLLSSKEIRSRCCVLVDEGSIEVVKGKCAGTGTSILQPIGYSYLPDVPLHVSSSLSKGERLFADLCQLVAHSTTPGPTATASAAAAAIPSHPNTHSYSPSPSAPTSPLPPTPAHPLHHALAPVPIPAHLHVPQSYSKEEVSTVRISKDQFSKGFLLWIANVPLESSFSSQNTALFSLVNRWSPAPALSLGGKIVPLGSRTNSPTMLKEPIMKLTGTEEINDRCGEQKENQSLSQSRSSPLNYGYDTLDSSHLVHNSFDDSVQNIQKKVLQAFTMSKEQLERLKCQHLLIFGLDISLPHPHTKGCHSHPSGHSHGDGGCGGDGGGGRDAGKALLSQDGEHSNQRLTASTTITEDASHIKRILFGNLPYATQQQAVKIFHSMIHAAEGLHDTEGTAQAQGQGHSSSECSTYPRGRASDSIPYDLNRSQKSGNNTENTHNTHSTHSGKENLKYTGAMEGKSMDRESPSDSIKSCDREINPSDSVTLNAVGKSLWHEHHNMSRTYCTGRTAIMTKKYRSQ